MNANGGKPESDLSGGKIISWSQMCIWKTFKNPKETSSPRYISLPTKPSARERFSWKLNNVDSKYCVNGVSELRETFASRVWIRNCKQLARSPSV